MVSDERARQFLEVRDAVRRFESANDWSERERILSAVKSTLLSFVRVFVGVARTVSQRAHMQRTLNPTQAMIEVSPTVWFMLKSMRGVVHNKKERDELRRLLDDLDRMHRSSKVEAHNNAERADDVVG
ncbi:MAG: hypothetical protein DRP63_09870 [Planctomycetota bacterium]|nr:MAG: hypothetical protein DRP63_09870 [Planctomycetota bacterium]